MTEVVYIKNNTELSAEEFIRLSLKIPEKEVIKAGRFKKWQDRQACILGKCLLGFLLEKNGCSREVMEAMESNQYGKPFVKDLPFHFNISHSGEYVICAFSDAGEIGIDIEQIKEIDLEDYASVLTAKEKEDLSHAAEKDQKFFKLWSSKEAVLKAQGGGLSFIEQIELEEDSSKALLKGQTYYLHDLNIDTSYSCFCASVFHMSDRVTVKEISLHILF